MKADWLIVGAGFTGATFAERVAAKGQRAVVVDRRSHLAGNAYDEYNEHGILVHRYGPHIFHTNSAYVWKYLSSFTEWRPYQHHVLGLVAGQLVPIPFNLNSIDRVFAATIARRLEQCLLEEYGHGKKVPILKLREAGRPELRELAEYVYTYVFEGYTLKQWGMRPEELGPGVTGRVPVHVSRDDGYFQDTYQAMPASGYTAMFQRMLSHSKIQILLNCDWTDVADEFAGARILYTGAIDELLRYRFGGLPYRSLRFVESTLRVAQHQPVGTVNYPNNHDFTRVTEMKILTGQQSSVTTLVTEYPMAHEAGKTTAYYPIPRDENQALYKRYLEAARVEFPNVVFAGRLGDYQYYNMDQACGRALKLAEAAA
jgi:UDP-galactopyranose mutase